MLANQPARWFNSNFYAAASACEHCHGLVRHERWCIVVNPRVQYAYEIVRDAEQLNFRDSLILHALGVSWTAPVNETCESI